ncbi:MAG: nucleotide exchange factor GrpE [Pseudomonadota bacterium]
MKRTDQKNEGNRNGTEIPVSEVDEADAGMNENGSAEAESVTIPRDEYDRLVQEAARAKEQYLLAVADFDNYRKRMEKEKEEIVCFANERLIHELLPILDNLQRALSTSLDKAGADSILEGVRMVNTQLHSVLGACGLEPVQAVGGPFDPQYHEAIGVLPSEEHDEGTVISELQKGYSLKGRILRPSIVHVAGQTDADSKDEGDS